MKRTSYTTTFTVEKSPDEAFAAINNVRGWWSGEVHGNTASVGDEFTYRVAGAHYSKQRITECLPGTRVVWHVTDSRLELMADEDEWTGTDIVFEIARQGSQTEVRFTHVGLAPATECYASCSSAWGMLINGNLRRLIATGEAQPSPW